MSRTTGPASISFGFPAAMGAWAAVKGERRVLSISGDGGFGVRVTDAADLADAFEAALEDGGPALVEIVADPEFT